jgi:hypothetical protein
VPDAKVILAGYIEISSLLLTLDLVGTAVFAMSGAAIGVKYRLDVFGICVLALVAGNAGGILRDLLIGRCGSPRCTHGMAACDGVALGWSGHLLVASAAGTPAHTHPAV